MAAAIEKAIAMTAQIPDIIFLDGKAFALLGTPLEAYFKRIKWRRSFRWTSTDNLRGYVARWEVFGKRLFLTGLLGKSWIIPPDLRCKLPPDPDQLGTDVMRPLPLKHLFPDQALLVFAKWVTGRLVVPTGPREVYVHFGFASLYASYRTINVVQGRIRSMRNWDGREWARRNGRFWPDEEWCKSNPQALVWLERSKEESGIKEKASPEGESTDDVIEGEEMDEPLPPSLAYERDQLATLSKPCGLTPTDYRPTSKRSCA
jgi:hypothetical protein